MNTHSLIKYFVVIISMVFVRSVYAQLPTNLEVVLNPVTPIITSGPDDNNVDTNQLYYYRFIFQVSDTVSISKIHAKIGTTEGGGEIMDDWFAFDQSINLPGNLQGYNRDSFMISLITGAFSWNHQIYCEVKLEDNNNQFSPQAKYQIFW